GMLTVPARQLGDADRAAVDRVLDAAPIAAAQVAERVRAAGIAWAPDARIFGYGERHRIDSVCWSGSNLIPVLASHAAATAFAEMAAAHPRNCSSLVGQADAVLTMWRHLDGFWGPAREVRPCQPLLVTSTAPAVPPDPTVRLVRPHEIDALF